MNKFRAFNKRMEETADAEDFAKNARPVPKQQTAAAKLAVSGRGSSRSGHRNQLRNEEPQEENSGGETSAHERSQSNYFNSMLSDRGLSRFDLDDPKWIQKSASGDSREESFDQDSTLPHKLANRLRTLIENDARRGSPQNSDDELLAHSPQRRILERGKEIVRKSGFGVDFTGKLVSKEGLAGTFEQFAAQGGFKTSLDLDLSQENRFWLEQKLGGACAEESLRGAEKREKTPRKRVSTGSDIQGITSTKYSDLYCQDNFEEFQKKQSQASAGPAQDAPDSGRAVETQNKTQGHEARPEGGSGGSGERWQSDSGKPLQKREPRASGEGPGGGGQSRRDSQAPGEAGASGNQSDLDILENGSFLNMADNNSSVVAGDFEPSSLKNSLER